MQFMNVQWQGVLKVGLILLLILFHTTQPKLKPGSIVMVHSSGGILCHGCLPTNLFTEYEKVWILFEIRWEICLG